MAHALGRTRMWHFLQLGLLIGACQPPDTVTHDLRQPLSATGAISWPGTVETALLVPGGNYSMVTVRKRSDQAADATDRDILCTAPSPDWATAYALAQQIAASGGVSGGASASLSASNSVSETISMLAGRSAGVVALRDGLYNACQAYANGVIGKDAYALILSQYGNLLVALAGGNGGSASSSAPSSSSGTPSGLAVAVSTGATPGSPAPAAPASSSGSAAGNAAVAQMQQEMLQAMFVACINENDLTVRPTASRNSLLTSTNCDNLITSVVSSAKALLTPAASSSGGGDTPPRKTAATPDPAIMAVQSALKNAGATIEPDGIWGPKTLAALGKYVNANPAGLASLEKKP